MANAYGDLEKALRAQYGNGVGFDVGAEGEVGADPDAFEVVGRVGFDVGGDGDGVGFDVGADDYAGGPRYSPQQALALMRKGAAMAGQIAARPAPRPRIVVMKRKDEYSQVYGGAMNEIGGQIPESSMVNFEASFADGAAIRIEMVNPQPFTLTGLTFDNNTTSTNAVRVATFSIGGLPVGGFPNLSVGRFTADGTRNRLPPTEVPAGTPIVFQGVAHAVAPATDIYLIIDVLGIPIVRGNKNASR